MTEYYSLYDYSQGALPSGHPFINPSHAGYWSSTTYVISPDGAWANYPFDDDDFANYKTKTHSVWAVRGGTVAQCTSPPSNLVSWWPGDGSGDDISGSNNGTLLNGAAFSSGMVDQAFSFDGVDDAVRSCFGKPQRAGLHNRCLDISIVKLKS